MAQKEKYIVNMGERFAFESKYQVGGGTENSETEQHSSACNRLLEGLETRLKILCRHLLSIMVCISGFLKFLK